MKIFTLLFCMALSAAWAMPVSALDFDEKINVVIDLPSGGIQEVRAESFWITDHPSEFLFFDAGSWAKRVELENAFFTPGVGLMSITAYDASGAPVDTGPTAIYSLVQTNPNVYEVVINLLSHSAVNSFVYGLDSDAKSVGLMPIIEVECVFDNEAVDIKADFVYDGIIVASDSVNFKGALACP